MRPVAMRLRGPTQVLCNLTTWMFPDVSACALLSLVDWLTNLANQYRRGALSRIDGHANDWKDRQTVGQARTPTE